MVHIFYYRSVSRLPVELFSAYLELMPPPIQNKIRAFRQWQDAERSLAGNILLLKGLQILHINGYTLAKLKYAEFGKPYFEGPVNFNIAHSGQYTICAISETHQVGIDVEEIKDIPLGDFTQFFYNEEWQKVLLSKNRLQEFYSLWTKKEAFLKVIGSGLNVPLNQVVIENNTIRWHHADWLLQEIHLDPTHISHFCTDAPLPAVTLNKIDLLNY